MIDHLRCGKRIHSFPKTVLLSVCGVGSFEKIEAKRVAVGAVLSPETWRYDPSQNATLSS